MNSQTILLPHHGSDSITTLLTRLAARSALGLDQPGAAAMPAILGTQLQPDLSADTSPLVLPKACLGIPMN